MSTPTGGHILPDPCQQQTTIQDIKHSLDRNERTLDRLVLALERVAEQNSRIEHLEEHTERNFVDMEQLFSRVRDIELNLASQSPATRQHQAEQIDVLNKKLDKVLNFIRIVTSKPAMYIMGALVAMVVTGTVFDLLYHFDAIKTIWAVTHG